ncbi:hypothetical protein CPR19092_LGOLGGFK_01089 [Companilactobacillus paralimentarius]|uniref:hypothetical protein n=1 Tax=Companilactobacillus TaxID=2767879 RepID=UPI002FF1D3E6
MEIAVYLDDDRNIIGVNNTSNIAAETQANEKGWTLIQNSDPAFSIDEMFKWTVRESDNKLVHISTGMTPDEETTQANALLGKNVGQAIVTANSADKKADSAIASAAQLGKLIAPLLATSQTNSNTTNGGTN